MALANVDDAIDVPSLTELLSPPSLTPLGAEYLSNLSNLSLEALRTEPTTLATQSHHLTSSLTSLTQTSYPTFLSLHKTTTALSSSLASLSSSLDALLTTSLPSLESSATGWKDRTDIVLKERRKARVVLEQHDKIRDLLDVPLLIDTCVRNGYFSEALALANHANVLAQRSTTHPPLIVQSVLAEVQHSISHMLQTLLATLREPNRKLPALWKAVNFLRKMEVFGPSSGISGNEGTTVSNEELIAISFLSGREACLKSSLEPSLRDIERLTNETTARTLQERDQEDLARFLKKYIDLWREGVYDIISQFNTIFLEGHSQQQQLDPKSPTTSTVPPPPPPLHALRPLITTHFNYALHSHLLPILNASLHLLQPTALPPLLTQLTYCSTAFSRVGADFRGVLAGMFVNAVVVSISKEMDKAGAGWVSKIKNAIGKSGNAESSKNARRAPKSDTSRTVKQLPSSWLVAPSIDATLPPAVIPDATKLAANPPHIPPTALASYPPLAEFANALLVSFNNLRLLAPVDAAPKLKDKLENVLWQGAQELLQYAKEIKGDEDELKAVRKVGEVYLGIFVPYLRRALTEGVFGIAGKWQWESGTGESSLKEVALQDGDESAQKAYVLNAWRLGEVKEEWEAWLNAA
ncbi:hypothetical protein AX16_000025 [Volvariella volvacea WC 439]|nr:hypothetical protein AX16_000025 [Volvariella volvacea WC 439]